MPSCRRSSRPCCLRPGRATCIGWNTPNEISNYGSDKVGLSKMKKAQPLRLSREIAWECRHFLGDRPCIWHKRQGALCTCEHYDQVTERLLVVKLDAMGDVLRSTALLPPIAEAHQNASIVWITRKESVPLLRQNRYVTEVLELGPEALLHLQTRPFD